MATNHQSFAPYVCERCSARFPDVGAKLDHAIACHASPLPQVRQQWFDAWRIARRIASHAYDERRRYSASQRAVAILSADPDMFYHALECLRERDSDGMVDAT